jgi:hypothetical protein
MQKKTLLLLFFIILKFALQYLLVSPEYELHRDEYLHLDQGKHLALGYLSVPPFTSWISFLILSLGNGEYWVRFFPALFGALTLLLAWKSVEELKGGLFALILVSVAVVFSVLLRLNILYQPNSMDTLCWVFLYFCVLKYITTTRPLWIWLAAIGFAVGFLNKYNIVFALIGLLPALLLTEHRNIFLKKTLYLSLAVGCVLISPNLWWQYQHGFPVFYHLRELTSTQLVNISRVSFLKDQLLFFIGSLFVLFAGIVSFLIYRPFKKYSVFLYAFIFTMGLFVLLRAKNYYSIGLYPILLAFGSVYIEQLLQGGWKRWLRPVAVAIPLLLFVPFIQIAFPLKSPAQINAHPEKFREFGLLRWEDGKEHALPQDFADMTGWKELAGIVDSTYASIADKEHTLVRCDNYGQAGAINFYSKYKNIQALSYNADYIYWFPSTIKWVNVILVKEVYDKDKARDHERPYFDTVYLSGQVKNEYAREKGTAVYSLLGARPGVNEILRKEIEVIQQRYKASIRR